jgi:hypothetical protein
VQYQEKKTPAEGESSEGEGKDGGHKAAEGKSAEEKGEIAAKPSSEATKPAENPRKQ